MTMQDRQSKLSPAQALGETDTVGVPDNCTNEKWEFSNAGDTQSTILH